MTGPGGVVVLGAGALGTLLAHGLAPLVDLRLLGRSPGPDWVEVEGQGRRAVRRLTEPVGPPAALLVVLVKAWATRDALRWAAPLIGPATVALTLQNGLGNAEALSEALDVERVGGAERVLVGSTARGSTLLAPGRVRDGGAGPTRVAPWQPGGPAAALLGPVLDLLTQAGFPAVAAPDPQVMLWSKLVVNAGINALTALHGVPNGHLLTEPGLRARMEAAAREAQAVALAAGIRLEGEAAERVCAVAAATASNRSSMLQDREAGRRTEVEAINGAVVWWGAALGVPTPVNLQLLQAVRAAEAGLPGR